MFRAAFLPCLLAAALAADVPQQIHIAFAGSDADGNSNGMTVSWQTVSSTSTSTVTYGTSASSLTITATGSSSSYYQTWDHHVVLSSLSPSTKYYYKCGDATQGWSEIYSFTTAPSSSSLTYPINIAIFGDMGIYNSEDSIAALASMGEAGSYDFLWHLGDISYADDDFLHTPLTDNYESTWNTFMNDIQPFAAHYPYMVLVGNHEAECHSPSCETSLDKLRHLSNFSAYNSRFHMPSQHSQGNSNMWYSFNYGPVHFINIDTETNYDGAPNDHYTLYSDNGDFWGDQMAWLEADLIKANSQRTLRPWVFVGGHRPVYSLLESDSSGYITSEPSASLKAEVEALFYKYGVDGYWAGHEHSYERQYPVYQTTTVETDYLDASLPFYIVQGAAGCDEEHSNYASAPSVGWNAFVDSTHYGLGLLTIESASKLSWKFFDSATLETIDTVTFEKTL